MSLLLRIAKARNLLPRMSKTEREALDLEEYLGIPETSPAARMAATA